MLVIGTALMHFVHTGTWGIADKDPGISGHDSYYHAKMAAMIPEHGVLKTFPWLRFCYFASADDGFVSNHYGYHVLLSPFVHASKWITGEYLPGGRWATSLCFGVNLMLFSLLLRSERVPWRWVWLILLMLLPFQFFTRHAFVRAIGPSLGLMLLLLLFFAMILFSFLGQRRDRKKRKAMINAVKKHDRVQTSGGVIGSVVEVNPDTVVLKVDETSNTRITFARSSIQQVINGVEVPSKGSD